MNFLLITAAFGSVPACNILIFIMHDIPACSIIYFFQSNKGRKRKITRKVNPIPPALAAGRGNSLPVLVFILLHFRKCWIMPAAIFHCVYAAGVGAAVGEKYICTDIMVKMALLASLCAGLGSKGGK